MYKQSPFSLLFGVKSENYLKRVNEFNEIVNSFENNLNFGCYSIISGIRGSGKTAMLTDLIEYYSNFEDWIIIELIPSMNLLEQLASKLIDKMNKIKNKYKLSFSFSFVGITFKITGKDKINDITLLIENLLLELKRKNIKVLIAIDEIEKNNNVIAFIQTYQILLREHLLVFLLMTGLYNNISDIQNVKSLTFLLRSQRTILEPLNLNMISNKYQQIFKIEKKNSDKLAIATKGYAFCYQLLGDILFKKEKTIIDEDVTNELDEKLYEYCYEKIYSDLSDIDKLIISAFKEERVYETNEILSSINMNIKLFSLYRDRLIKRGILISRGYGKIELILPRFNIVTLKYTIEY